MVGRLSGVGGAGIFGGGETVSAGRRFLCAKVKLSSVGAVLLFARCGELGTRGMDGRMEAKL